MGSARTATSSSAMSTWRPTAWPSWTVQYTWKEAGSLNVECTLSQPTRTNARFVTHTTHYSTSRVSSEPTKDEENQHTGSVPQTAWLLQLGCQQKSSKKQEKEPHKNIPYTVGVSKKLLNNNPCCWFQGLQQWDRQRGPGCDRFDLMSLVSFDISAFTIKYQETGKLQNPAIRNGK